LTYSATTTVTSQTDVAAGYNVTNTLPFGNVTVNTGANVTYQAPHAIILGNNFTVQNGATFTGSIITSPCY
jgi:hypothetical protein